MPKGTWTAKDERKYEAILESCQFGKRRRSKKTCQRIAAATVNRDRHAGLGAPAGLQLREVDTGSKRAFEFQAYLDGERVGEIGVVRRNEKIGGRVVYAVHRVRVEEAARRKGIATKLYEAAAQEACRRRSRLASTGRDPKAHSHDFWAKQAAKGRAEVLPGRGERGQPVYILDCAFARDLSGARQGKTSKSSCPHAKRFSELVNMTPAEIRAWSKDPRSKLASWASTRARLPALAKLKAKPVAQWTEADCKFAARVVSFNARMDGMRKEHGCTTKIDVSLRNWGRRAPGCKLPKKP